MLTNETPKQERSTHTEVDSRHMTDPQIIASRTLARIRTAKAVYTVQNKSQCNFQNECIIFVTTGMK